MRTDSKRHRHSIRLKDFDYGSDGAYFITVCTKGRECLFSELSTSSTCYPILTQLGEIVRHKWLKTPTIRREISLDEFVIMPNHIHAIVIINKNVGAYGHTPLQSPHVNKSYHSIGTLHSPSMTLGALIRGFKSAVTFDINRTRRTPREPVWQRNYYEHVIRDEYELNLVREYIIYNPIQWKYDKYNIESIENVEYSNKWTWLENSVS